MLHAQLVFRGADGQVPRPVPAASTFRLWFPYVTGDLYGAPGAGELQHPQLAADGSFALDLNRSIPDLLPELEPTHFSLPYLHVAPAAAQLARLAPAVLQAEGIDPLGSTDWIDARSGSALLLLYVDRPARIFGETLAQGERIVYDIRASEAGYLWVGRREQPGRIEYVRVAAPERLLLAVSEPSP